MADFDDTLNKMLDERIEEMESDGYEPVPGVSRATLAVALALAGVLLASIVIVYLSI